MITVLFLSERGRCRGPMAVGFANAVCPANVAISHAALSRGSIHPLALAVMSETAVEVSDELCPAISEMDLTGIDLVITLSSKSRISCSILPGVPAVVHWDMPDVLEVPEADRMNAFRTLRDDLRRRVDDFFSGGYLPALTAMKHNNELVLDHFSNGIMAHDTDRIITWFNRAAEQITGFSREEVIGRDCHDVLGQLCGGQCLFNGELPNFEHIHYPIRLTTKDGHHRKVEMTVVALRNGDGVMQGVLANFHDVTEVTQLRHTLKQVQSFHGLIGSDEKMQRLYEMIGDLAGSDFSVLIQGESGTGKELAAGAIHGESRRRGKPFVTVNCGALPEGILESELFGHVRGAFTGAIRDKKGRFELADGGTIFLDEVAELSPAMQVKLLRVLQEGTFERVGDEKPIHVNVRLLSATNRDLKMMVRQGKFREDLYYRLCVVPVTIPPLRSRRMDIPILVNHFIARFSQEAQYPIRGINPAAMHYMMDYPWPGNVRELQNAIQYALVKSKDNYIHEESLPPEILSHVAQQPLRRYPRQGKLTEDTVKDAIHKAKGNKVKAAQLLGVGRATLYRFLKYNQSGN